jgi:hypothetical protein
MKSYQISLNTREIDTVLYALDSFETAMKRGEEDDSGDLMLDLEGLRALITRIEAAQAQRGGD